MTAMYSPRHSSWTRLAVAGAAIAVLSGCTSQSVDGQAVRDATYQPSRNSEAASNQSPLQAPKAVYPTADGPTENPGVGLGVPTHPPTDFSLIPGN